MARTPRSKTPRRRRSRGPAEEISRFHVLAVNLTSGTYRYVKEVFYLGWEGSFQNPDEMGINPDLKQLITGGVHHVLRGGKVAVVDDKNKDSIELRVTRAPREGVEALNARLERSIEESRELMALLGVEGVDALT